MVIMPNHKLNVPCIQVALDMPDWNVQKKIIEQLPNKPNLIIEAGTPLIKKYGVDIIQKIREIRPDAFIVADLKTLDIAEVEVDISVTATADAVVVSGLASPKCIDKFITETKKHDIFSIVDMMEVADPVSKLRILKEIPDIIIFHRAIDAEGGVIDPRERWKLIPKIKELFKAKKNVYVATAGGLDFTTSADAIKMGADILIIGRTITGAPNIKEATEKMLEFLIP